MTDPLAELVTLLQPSIAHSKMITATGAWRVTRSESGQPFYCAVLDGGCWLAVAGQAPALLQPHDFVLIPAAHDFAMYSIEPIPVDASDAVPVELRPGEYRLGAEGADVGLRMVIGHCSFASDDADLLVSLLPEVLHVRANPRLAIVVQLVGDEFSELRPVRHTVLARLMDVVFIEALRSTVITTYAPGFLCGLGDERIAMALRKLHEDPSRAWSVSQLAKEAALSRSAFFERFSRVMGVSPMAYLLTWRMALAKQWLCTHKMAVSEVAQRTGYGSSSTFTVAFTRHTGVSPARYGRTRTQ